jgi:hypothetical protein
MDAWRAGEDKEVRAELGEDVQYYSGVSYISKETFLWGPRSKTQSVANAVTHEASGKPSEGPRWPINKGPRGATKSSRRPATIDEGDSSGHGASSGGPFNHAAHIGG